MYHSSVCFSETEALEPPAHALRILHPGCNIFVQIDILDFDSFFFLFSLKIKIDNVGVTKNLSSVVYEF